MLRTCMRSTGGWCGRLGGERPDVAVLIDFPDVNFRLAKHLQAAGGAGGVVCESAALGVEAAAAALGAAAGGPDDGDLSV